MKFIERHKAFIITFLLTGIVVFSLFSVHITKHMPQMAETFYDILSEPEKEELNDNVPLDNSSPETDKALNQDTEFKALMKNFRSVQPNDFEKTTKALEEASQNENQDEEISSTRTYSNDNAYALKQSETESYKKLKATLDKHKPTDNTIDEHADKNSSLSYSLKGRALVSYNTPRYLCERFGKIVVSIRVNRSGEVFDAYINGASNSKDECLIEHAIEYAKAVRFDSSENTDQLGTITFYFKGKG